MAQKTLRDSLQETEDAIHLDHIDDALAHCLHILAYFPESLETQRLLGEIYLAQGRLDEAQQAFDWVLTNDPENVIAYCNRALVSERLSDFDTALDCYQQAYELSRGNGQIRQQFNRLSSRTGQAGFMLSRAGLARLYMRGDLLTQSIQEWESVLAVAPDRLDARAGLLETYWRAGLYEQVVSLATQILRDVSSCLKALLLLAHVTAPNNIQQAQDLLRRAEVVDPDQVMALDLFSDLLASQPDNPFLRLLQKPPASLDSPSEVSALAMLGRSNGANASTFSHENSGTPVALDNFAHWGNGSNGTRDISQDLTPLPEVPDLLTQLRNDITLDAPWRNSDQVTQTSQQGNSELEPWQMLQEALQDMSPKADMLQDQSRYEDPQWEILEAFSAPGPNGVSTAEGGDAVAQEEVAVPWSSSTKEVKSSAPPAWLSMLTQADKRQSGSSSSLEEEAMLAASQSMVDPVSSISPSWEAARQETVQREEEPVQKAPATIEQDEDSFFGPEWLKSIGATSLDLEVPVQSEVRDIPMSQEPQAIPQAAESQATYEPWISSQNSQEDLQAPQDTWMQQTLPSESGQVEESWMDQLSRSESHQAYDAWADQTPASAQGTELSWMEQMAERLPENGPANDAEREEENLVTTLEELEKGLRSKGFIPMEPKTLSVIAQTQEARSASDQPEPFMLNTPAEPAWIASLRSTTPSTTEVPEQVLASQEETVSGTAPVAGPARQKTRELPRVEPVPPSSPFIDEPYETIKVAAIGRKASLDGGLETTMKRPAVRLQPIQQRSYTGSGREQPASTGKGRYVERPINKAADGNMSNRERLLKGYQSQLIGEYDEAMQEYRIVIRNAPELLGDVVSNVRALLKLAPKYSVGYRVLGDAYMRQGEYLQAMEAYNKALTMAKKTKS